MGETAVSVFGRTDNGFATDVETGIDNQSATGKPFKCCYQSMEFGICSG